MKKFPKYPDNWKLLSERCKRQDGLRCTKCGRRGSSTNKLQAHHIISKSKGGPDAKANLRTLCEECHALIHRHMKKSLDKRRK